MSIKGTLETFNLRELLQMLAFNQKVGTLVLETALGPRTIYVDQGRAGFVEGDPAASETLLRLLRRHRAVDAERLERAVEIQGHSDRFLGDILVEMGLLDEETRNSWYEFTVAERLFSAQLSAINRFEFVEGEALRPDGTPGAPIEPTYPVDGLLLELTRKVDHWQVITQVIPTTSEVFEGTEVTVDLAEVGDTEIDLDVAEQVAPALDGYHTLDRISEITDVDLYSVVLVAAALFEGGGVRPVPTEDLIARADELIERGQPSDALPLLRRGIERGDAPVETRLRIADAFAVSGDADSAAAELDAFAALADEGKAPSVFLALQRALVLRGGNDVATASRLCDYYLRHRPWLREYHKDAKDALRQLIRAAASQGRVLEAASRLAAFIENGDAPSEDLLVLADLYIAENQNREAADALNQLAETLLVSDCTARARELLRRALDLDPTRVDARRRIMELDGVARQRRQRRRIFVAVVLFLVVALGAASAWWTYSQEAGRAVNLARREAESAVHHAEQESNTRMREFEAVIAKFELARDIDVDLAAEAVRLSSDVRQAVAEASPLIAEYEAEVENYPASGEGDAQRVILRGLMRKLDTIRLQSEGLLESVGQRATLALARAEDANASGEFTAAREALLRARNFAFQDRTTFERARLLLSYVDQYFTKFRTQSKRIDDAQAKGDIRGAFQIGAQTIVEMLDSDLTRTLRLPVRVTSKPTGAKVLLGGEPTGQVTPCVIVYSPFSDDATIRVRMPGHENGSYTLPAFKEIQESPNEVLSWSAHFEATLMPGPRFVVHSPGTPFTALWMNGGVPVVVEGDGRTAHGVNPDTGELRLGTRSRNASPLRMAGTFDDGSEWQIRGQRTLLVQPAGSEPWEIQAQGRLERRPLVVSGTVCTVDEVGTLYGYDIKTGQEIWRETLGAGPTQAPYLSALGVLVAAQNGAAFIVDAVDGSMTSLAPAAHGHVFALPFPEGAVFIGGGESGCRSVRADGSVHTLGDASPVPGSVPWVTSDGVAWIGESGVYWLGNGSTGPVHLVGLGTDVRRITGDGHEIYGITSTGELLSANVTTPEQTAFRLDLGGAPDSDPMPLGRTVFIVVNGALVAVER